MTPKEGVKTLRFLKFPTSDLLYIGLTEVA
jgi:hypothetical protein